MSAPQVSAGEATATELLPQHQKLLEASAISPAVAQARGYWSATAKGELRELGFSPAQSLVPALVVPVYGVDGEIVTYQARPDRPRVGRDGKALKYETPRGSSLVLDVPPPARALLGAEKVPLFVTEGARKADAAVGRGLCCVALLGVWGWRGGNEQGGKTALADWEYVALKNRVVYVAFDSDAMVKHEVHQALERLGRFLGRRGAEVRYIYLPALDGGAKCGLDDFLAAGNDVDALLACASDKLRRPAGDPGASGDEKPKARLRPASELVEEITAFVRRYIRLPSDEAALAIALWVMHTWAFDAAHATPYLVIHSPVKGCGKSHLLETLELLVRSPWRIAAASEAAMFRRISMQRPTALMDEVDALFGSGSSERTEPIRGLLNAGNRPGAAVARVVGEGTNMEVKDFPVYCPKVLAGIDTGRWPDTVLDRAIVITLHKKKSSEQVNRFRHRFADQDAAPLRGQLQRWAEEHTETLQAAVPALPDDLSDRKADAWEALFAIADTAELGEKARAAALAISGGQDSSDDALTTKLLASVRTIFGDQRALATDTILAGINGDDELPFGAWRDGKGLDGRKLATLLRPFKIRPKAVRVGGDVVKGYQRDQFEDAWQRYVDSGGNGACPPGQDSAVTSVTSPAQSQIPAVSIGYTDPSVTDREQAAIPPGERDATDVTAESCEGGDLERAEALWERYQGSAE